jgi:hypothetical protein
MSNWKVVGFILPSRLSSLWCPPYANYVAAALDSDAFWEGVAEASAAPRPWLRVVR